MAAFLLLLAALIPAPVLAQGKVGQPPLPSTMRIEWVDRSEPSRQPTSEASQPADELPVDINSASPAELDALKGIGKKTAAKIVAGRPYASLEELVLKQALTARQLERLRSRLVVR